jgi:hypothetical protein
VFRAVMHSNITTDNVVVVVVVVGGMGLEATFCLSPGDMRPQDF